MFFNRGLVKYIITHPFSGVYATLKRRYAWRSLHEVEMYRDDVKLYTLLLSGKGKLQNTTTHSVIPLCNDFYMVDFLDIKKSTDFISNFLKLLTNVTYIRP